MAGPNWLCLVPFLLVAALIIILTPVTFKVLLPPTVNNVSTEGLTYPFTEGSTVHDKGFVDYFGIGNGPVQHNALYRTTHIDVKKNNPRRRIVVVEKQKYREGQCGKITDFDIQHPDIAQIPRAFFETPYPDNYHEGVYDALLAINNRRWKRGAATLRWIKNGDNEPSRCNAHQLGMSGFCSRFKPTTYDSWGAKEDNVDFR